MAHPCLEGCEHNDRTATIEANERIALLEKENELLREQVRLRKELAAVSQAPCPQVTHWPPFQPGEPIVPSWGTVPPCHRFDDITNIGLTE